MMSRHRQLHLWITDHDYVLLKDLASERKETLSSVIRRLIKLHPPVPRFLEGDRSTNHPGAPGVSL